MKSQNGKGREVYLRRAVRGLWGERRRAVELELRGAVEDKVYRYALLGMGEQEAEAAALRDLGDPGALARELGMVHSGPPLAWGAALLGLFTVLSLQAAAQVGSVRAAPYPRACTYDEAYLSRLTPEARAAFQRTLLRLGRVNLEAQCRNQPRPNSLLRLSDLKANLRAAGIEVRTLPGTDAFLQLRLPQGEWQSLNLNDSLKWLGEGKEREPYVSAGVLTGALRYSFKGEVALSGLENPVLQIGPARLQLGTAATPLHVAELLSDEVYWLVRERLTTRWAGPVGDLPLITNPQLDGAADYQALQYRVPQDGLYAVVGTVDGRLGLTVFGAPGGVLSLPTCPCADLRVVSTERDLEARRRYRQPGMLVYRVTTGDLRALTLTPLPPREVTLVTR